MSLGQEKEQHIQRCQWDNIQKIPEDSFIDYFIQQMKEYGDKPALIDAITHATVKYNDLVRDIFDLSFGWHNKGLEEGDVICLVTPNHIQAPLAFMAGVAAKCPVTFANPLYKPDELKRHLNDSNSKWIVGHPAVIPSIQAATKDLDSIKGMFVLGEDAVGEMKPLMSLSMGATDDWKKRPGLCGEDVIHIPYSSGTTGLPKGVKLTSHGWLATISVIGRKEYMDLSKEDVCLGILPFFHVFGIGMMLGSLYTGGTMIVLPRFLPDVVLDAIQRYKITAITLVPPIAIFLAKSELVNNYNLNSVSNIMCGAAPLSKNIQEALSKRLGGVRVRQGYGMTETTLATFTSETTLPGAVGTIVPNVTAKVVDMSTGDSLEPGEDGEICIKGDLIMKGYLHNESATSAMIDSNGWLHTGDIGHYDETGIFFVVDRIKELIKYKGFQVAPAELEGLLLTHSDIADVGVIGVPDEVAGEIPKAFIVVKPNHNVDPEEVIEWVKSRTAPHKHLRGGVKIVSAIPRSPAGKILRRLLKDIV